MKNLTESSNFEKANNLYLSYMWQWLKKHQNYLTAVSNSKLVGVNVKKKPTYYYRKMSDFQVCHRSGINCSWFFALVTTLF